MLIAHVWKERLVCQHKALNEKHSENLSVCLRIYSDGHFRCYLWGNACHAIQLMQTENNIECMKILKCPDKIGVWQYGSMIITISSMVCKHICTTCEHEQRYNNINQICINLTWIWMTCIYHHEKTKMNDMTKHEHVYGCHNKYEWTCICMK
jgi:hypothetical protein